MPLEIEFNRSMLSATLRFLSYSSTQASLLPTLIHRAARWRSRAARRADHHDGAAGRRPVGERHAEQRHLQRRCAVFCRGPHRSGRHCTTYQGTDQLDALAEICKLWPRGPVDPDLHSPLKSDIPTLLLSGEADPVTPPARCRTPGEGFAAPSAPDTGRRGAWPDGHRLRAETDGGVSGHCGSAGARCDLSRRGIIPRLFSSA